MKKTMAAIKISQIDKFAETLSYTSDERYFTLTLEEKFAFERNTFKLTWLNDFKKYTLTESKLL